MSTDGGDGDAPGEGPASTAAARAGLLALYRQAWSAPDGTALHYARLLVALEEAILRQRAPLSATIVPLLPIAMGGVALDPLTQVVRLPGVSAPIALTPQEVRLLHLLLSAAGTVVTPDDVARRVWGTHPDGTARVQTQQVRQHIMRLRRKIEPDPSAPRYLVTVPGIGYTFLAPETGSVASNNDHQQPSVTP